MKRHSHSSSDDEQTQLLDELLVLVELLERISVHVRQVEGLGLVHVVGIDEDADLHLGAGDVGQQERAGETLVALGIVVLEGDLEIDRLGELALQGEGGGWLV